MATITPPPHHLEHQPEVLWGCSLPELYLLMGGALAFWLPLLLTLGAFTGLWLVAPPLAALLGMGSTWLGAKQIRWRKRGRPEQLLRQQNALWRQRWGLIPALFIQRGGPWSIGRHHVP